MRRLLLLALLATPAYADPTRVFYLAPPGDAVPETLNRLGYACEAVTELPAHPGHAVVVGSGPSVLALANTQPELAGVIELGNGPTPQGVRVPTLIVRSNGNSTTIGTLEVRRVDHPTARELTRDDSPTQKAVRHFLAEVAPRPREGLAVDWVASPNWEVRPVNAGIDAVVVHSTVINTLEGTERAFLDDKVRRVSAHYVVDRDGHIVQMVDERMAAWHAGVSYLAGRRHVNDFSVGIELVNLNDGKDPYTEAQYAAVARIVRHLRENHDVPDERIVSHAAVARPLGRKSDPVGFDFAHLRALLQ